MRPDYDMKSGRKTPGKDEFRFRTGDGIAAGAVVLCAVALLAGLLIMNRGGDAGLAKIYLQGELIREVSLAGDTEFLIEGEYRNTVTVRDGKIAVTESDCPGEDCVHSGWVSRPGRSIVCLPNRVEIRLEGTAEADDVDAVVR